MLSLQRPTRPGSRGEWQILNVFIEIHQVLVNNDATCFWIYENPIVLWDAYFIFACFLCIFPVVGKGKWLRFICSKVRLPINHRFALIPLDISTWILNNALSVSDVSCFEFDPTKEGVMIFRKIQIVSDKLRKVLGFTREKWLNFRETFHLKKILNPRNSLP